MRIYTHREKERDKAMRGFIVRIKKMAEESNLIYKNKEGVIMLTIGIGEKKVIIISIYNRESWKNLEEKLERIL